MEFLFGIMFGVLIGWLIFESPYFRKKTVAGRPNCEKLKQTILFSFDNIEKENAPDFRSEVMRTLRLYGSVKATDDTHFVLTNATACLGEIHHAITQGVAKQPVELVSPSVQLGYASLSAEGNIVGEVVVTIHATPGSTVTLANRSEAIKIDKSGRSEVKVRFTRDELLRGYLAGKATKGGLSTDIRIAIT